MTIEIRRENSYTGNMSAKKLEQISPLPEINLKELCRSVRKQAGLTQAELAKVLGVSKRSVEYWESPTVDAEPNGQPIAKLYELKRLLDSESNKQQPA